MTTKRGGGEAFCYRLIDCTAVMVCYVYPCVAVHADTSDVFPLLLLLSPIFMYYLMLSPIAPRVERHV